MSSDGNTHTENAIRVELKYCEHCGGLYIREPGAGVYCAKCQARVAELPRSTRKKRRPTLPVLKATAVERYGLDVGFDRHDFEAAGGPA